MISIHALHEESDAAARPVVCSHEKFQSTLSMRRATFTVYFNLNAERISIHALHEESDQITSQRSSETTHISIHALHEESDVSHTSIGSADVAFQSTLSMRRATKNHAHERDRRRISIHALHEESDRRGLDRRPVGEDFNPRSP